MPLEDLSNIAYLQRISVSFFGPLKLTFSPSKARKYIMLLKNQKTKALKATTEDHHLMPALQTMFVAFIVVWAVAIPCMFVCRKAGRYCIISSSKTVKLFVYFQFFLIAYIHLSSPVYLLASKQTPLSYFFSK